MIVKGLKTYGKEVEGGRCMSVRRLTQSCIFSVVHGSMVDVSE